MAILKTSELTGPPLDWAVAKALGYFPANRVRRTWGYDLTRTPDELACTDYLINDAGYSLRRRGFEVSTNWAQGGPIIEREKIDCIADPNGKDVWMGRTYGPRGGVFRLYGPTPLIAAMRCFVASKLGDSVDIPDVLV